MDKMENNNIEDRKIISKSILKYVLLNNRKKFNIAFDQEIEKKNKLIRKLLDDGVKEKYELNLIINNKNNDISDLKCDIDYLDRGVIHLGNELRKRNRKLVFKTIFWIFLILWLIGLFIYRNCEVRIDWLKGM